MSTTHIEIDQLQAFDDIIFLLIVNCEYRL